MDNEMKQLYGVYITGGGLPDRWLKDDEGNPARVPYDEAMALASARNATYNGVGIFYTVKVME